MTTSAAFVSCFNFIVALRAASCECNALGPSCSMQRNNGSQLFRSIVCLGGRGGLAAPSQFFHNFPVIGLDGPWPQPPPFPPAIGHTLTGCLVSSQVWQVMVHVNSNPCITRGWPVDGLKDRPKRRQQTAHTGPADTGVGDRGPGSAEAWEIPHF